MTDMNELYTTRTFVTSNHKRFNLFDKIKFTRWDEDEGALNQYTGTIVGFDCGQRNKDNYIILSDVIKNGKDKSPEVLFYFSELMDCDYEKPSLSKIWDILYAEDSVIVFDIDGVLAAYEYGSYNHNACREADWNDFVSHEEVYDKARPLKVLQKYVHKKGKDQVFVCSQADEHEREQKCRFVEENYGIDKSHIFFVKQKADKLGIMKEIQKTRYPSLEDRKLVMVDDSTEVLNNIQENSNFSTVHISTFME